MKAFTLGVLHIIVDRRTATVQTIHLNFVPGEPKRSWCTVRVYVRGYQQHPLSEGPRIGLFSEAQVYCIVVACVSGVVLFFLGMAP